MLSGSQSAQTGRSVCCRVQVHTTRAPVGGRPRNPHPRGPRDGLRRSAAVRWCIKVTRPHRLRMQLSRASVPPVHAAPIAPANDSDGTERGWDTTGSPRCRAPRTDEARAATRVDTRRDHRRFDGQNLRIRAAKIAAEPRKRWRSLRHPGGRLAALSDSSAISGSAWSTRNHSLDRLQNGCSASFLVEGAFDSHAPPQLEFQLKTSTCVLTGRPC
jgi:hypothetical protein